MMPVQMLFGFAFLAPLVAAAYVRPGFCSRRRQWIVTTWGRSQLAILGIAVELHGAEHLATAGPGILLFNHQSVLDLLVVSSIWPDNAVVLYKKEFHRVPVLGRMLRALGMLPIDRSNRQQAVATMAEAARTIREQGMKVGIAPEGTRSKSDGLLPFKRGPFHLALKTGAPMIPIVLRGVRQVLPPGSMVSRGGTIRVDVLPPIETSDWTQDALERHIAETRALYTSYVPPQSEPG